MHCTSVQNTQKMPMFILVSDSFRINVTLPSSSVVNFLTKKKKREHDEEGSITT